MWGILFISFSLNAQIPSDVVLRAPQADIQSYLGYLKEKQKHSYTQKQLQILQTQAPDTRSLDACLEALAFQPLSKNEVCFESVQQLKNELWTESFQRILKPFFERLLREKLKHRELYQSLLSGLQVKSDRMGKIDGEQELFLREITLFQAWLENQPEWQDAVIFANGKTLQTLPNGLSAKRVVQWFLVSNAGRQISFIGRLTEFRSHLEGVEDFRFLDCDSVQPTAFAISNIESAEYFYSKQCVVLLKKAATNSKESIYSRWNQMQNKPMTSTSNLSSEAKLPKWFVPVITGLALGAIALKGKKVSFRSP